MGGDGRPRSSPHGRLHLRWRHQPSRSAWRGDADMTRRAIHSPGVSVVDIWDRKKRRGLAIWNQGKRWLGRAQTKPGVARYRTKAFLHETDAWEWAEQTVAKYRLGLDNGNRCSI